MSTKWVVGLLSTLSVLTVGTWTLVAVKLNQAKRSEHTVVQKTAPTIHVAAPDPPPPPIHYMPLNSSYQERLDIQSGMRRSRR